jgi:hypothetical protein
MDKIFGREPILWTTLFAVVLQFVTAFGFALTEVQQATLNAAFAVVLGGVAAAFVSVDRFLPLLVGIIQAVLQVGVAFGLSLSPEQQTTVLAVVAAAVAFWTRGQVEAPIPPVDRARAA